ncbi:regulator of cell morphogenesis and NO signaling [Escherichia coli]|uniref:Regulator of cell morphogenesis and NO signaling n=1 Tax=Escherichia coli TaxID=562 RepID=A0A2X1P995_ECOLX|nr:regulator of cell morphogenesis and NO signaling [Escherichia coli]
MAYRDQPLGELALSIPRASALFRKYDMDYCCGGKQRWRVRRHVKNWMLRFMKLSWQSLLNNRLRKTGVAPRWQKSSTISSCATTIVTASNCRS